MPEHPPGKMPRITPYLLYEDAAAALDWLSAAFGFRERLRQAAPDGGVRHAEMELEDGVILLGCPGPGYRNPARLGGVTQSLYVYVGDVDAHCRRARESGAKIIEEPGDQAYGDRRYGARDPEGHHWYFAAPIRNESPGGGPPG